ncbi:hypothetical protein BV20DRAFT_911570, partial [Pilatotrama ljubarskyi]
MPPSPPRAQPLRVPCPVTDGNPKLLNGLYFGNSSADALPVEIVTVFPPCESALAKRFPLFEAVLGTMEPTHECTVRVAFHGLAYRFLVAYQDRPGLPPSPAFRNLVPSSNLTGEIVVMRSGTRALVRDMVGLHASSAAKKAVRKFIVAAEAHHARYKNKTLPPPLPT